MRKSIRKLLLGAVIALVLCTAALADNSVRVSSYEEAEKALLACIAERQPQITLVGWSENVTYQQEENMIMLLRRAAANAVPTGGSGADYDVMNVHTVLCRLQDKDLSVHFSYLTTREQERELDESCAEILRSLALDGDSDYEKVEKIYEYVGTHFVYDKTLSTFSAYSGLKSGKMVCQGYALLMYKLLWAEGIPCRIVSGVAGSTPHGWNLVQLDGKWYNLDVTWDACDKPGEAMGFVYFLRANKNFPAHIAHNPYRTDSFMEKHPISEEDYDCNEVLCMLQNETIGGMTLRLGKSVTMSIHNTKNRPLSYTLRVTDPSVAEITPNGTLTAKKAGSCSVIVTADERGVVPAMWKFTAVDLTTASSWAQKDVEDYYLAGLLPDTLCADFQNPITRAELTRLLYPVLRTIPTKPGEHDTFGDIFYSEDKAYIEYAAFLGIVNGTGNGHFSPDATLTREQAAKIIALTAEKLGCKLPDGTQKLWADAEEIGAWAGGHIRAVDAAGIMQGTGEGRFSPKGKLTREQMICMLARMMDFCAEAKNAA